MKLFSVLLTLTFIALLQNNVFPQEIPNGGFENWTSGDPDNWITFDFGFYNSVTQSGDAHSGSSAARMEVVDVGGQPYAPWLISGGDGAGIPVSGNYQSLVGYYKFFPLDNDVILITVSMLKGQNYVGGGILFLGGQSSYTQFAVPISSSEVPDTAIVEILVSDSSSEGAPSIGSYALIDDLSFGGPTDVSLNTPVASSFSLLQNYPNPFNPSTKINFSISEQSFVSLTVYDILGHEISKLINNNYPAGEYSIDFNAENLPGGVYIAKLSAGKFSKAIKMMLLK